MATLKNYTYSIALLLIGICASGKVITITTQYDQPYQKNISDKLTYRIDSTGALAVREVLQLLPDFMQWNKPQVHLGSLKYPVWFSAQILNNSGEQVILRIEYPILDTVEFYLVERGEIVKSFTTGSSFPFSKREFTGNYFKISIPQGQYMLLFKVSSFYNVQFSASLYNWNALNQINNQEGILHGIYIGFVLLVVIYSLFLFRKIRDEIFVYYIFHTIATAIITLHLYGYTFRFLWPYLPVINSYEPMIYGLGIFTTIFSIKFLRPEQLSLFWSKVLWSVFWINIPVFILPIIGFKDFANILVQLVGSIGCFLMLLAGIFLLIKGYKPAKYYIVAFCFLLLGVILSILARMNVIPNHPFFIHASQYGSALDITFLSLAIGDRITAGLAERNQLKAQLLKETIEKENLVKHQNLLLKEEVEKQTKQLQIANADLEKLSNELRQQNKFQTRFLSVVGHDLKNSLSNIAGIIEAYSVELKKADLNIYNLLCKSIQNTNQILENLLLYFRINTSDLRPKIKYIDPQNVIRKVADQLVQKIQNKGIQLDIDSHEDCKIIADEFYLEVIIRNILENAIKFTPKRGKILINVSSVNHSKKAIEIKDSGSGMTEENIAKFLNPNVNFTTPGTDGESGTGIGRILIKELTEAMNGTLKIVSKPGHVTSFVLIFDSYRK